MRPWRPQSANYGKPVSGLIPGEVLLDPNGNLLGMTEAREVSGLSGGTFITAQQAEDLGIEPGHLPGIDVIDLDT